jgi:hypothetical protein
MDYSAGHTSAMNRRWLVAVVSVCAGVLTGCGFSASGAKNEHASVPPNVTVRESIPMPGRIPDNLLVLGSQLADLVDFHDADFSGSWFVPSTSTFHIGVANRSGRALLGKQGLLDDRRVVVEEAERSLATGQRFAARYVRHSALRDVLVGWGTLPRGDGIELFVHAHHLSPDQVKELGALPSRVVVILGQNSGTLS